jgi:preprotein translocase subunit SecE
MNSKIDAQESSFDVVKFLIALSVVVVSLIGFYYYADASKLFRVLGVLTGVGISGLVVASTSKGKNTIAFIREAQLEVRKIVWPTRQETLQTTLFVMIVVIVFAILLWVLDLGLSSSIQALIGKGV